MLTAPRLLYLIMITLIIYYTALSQNFDNQLILSRCNQLLICNGTEHNLLPNKDKLIKIACSIASSYIPPFNYSEYYRLLISISVKKYLKMDFNKIEEILLCPICQEISFPPIYQFGNGHVVCSKCIRALVSEQLTETMEVNCKHWENGCQTKFLFKDAKSHLQDCLYE